MPTEPDDDTGGFADSAAEIATLYGLGAPTGALVPAARGEQGAIWRMETTTGPYAVKVLTVRQRDEDAARDVAFQERAASAATSYDVGRTVRTADGRVLATVGDRQIRVMGWLDMADPDPGVDPALVGQMLAELHAVGDSRTDEVDPWFAAPVGADRWQEYLVSLAAGEAVITPRLEAVAPELVALEELLAAPSELRTCHRDLWADNVRQTSSGRLCVFDWDNCGPANVDHELAMLVWEYGLDDVDRIRTLFETYVDAGGPGRISSPGDFTMIIAQFGHFYEMAVRPFLDLAATDDDRAHGIDRFDEFDSRPLTLDSITQILAVTQGR